MLVSILIPCYNAERWIASGARLLRQRRTRRLFEALQYPDCLRSPRRIASHFEPLNLACAGSVVHERTAHIP